MKRLLAALLIAAWPADAQVNVTGAPCSMTDGNCTGYGALSAVNVSASAQGVIGATTLRGGHHALPKVEVSDDFDRADGALGANWSTGFTIASNVVRKASPGYAYIRWTANAFAANQYSEVYIPVLSYPNMAQGPGVRIAGSSGYFLLVSHAGAGEIYKVTSGSFLLLAGAAQFTPPTIARIEVVGEVINVYRLSSHGGAATLVLTTTDGSFASGSVGMMASGQFGGGDLDNFYGGDL